MKHIIMASRIWIVGGLVSVLLLAGAFLLGMKASISSQGTFQAGWDAAKMRLQETGYGGGTPTDAEMKSVSGIVETISGKTFTVKTTPSDPLSNVALDTRIIDMSRAKVVKLVSKDQDVYQQELDIFNQKSKEQFQSNSNRNTQDVSMIFPDAYTHEPAVLTDIHEGDLVTFIASTDIRNQKQFIAEEADVMFFPTMEFPAPAKQ
jgi:hypothetical protein